jgi:hypothetical protein
MDLTSARGQKLSEQFYTLLRVLVVSGRLLARLFTDNEQ